MKGFVVAGTASGVGKTTLTLGVIAALRRRGLSVQPFKVGPDYIDPSYHAVAAGRPCRNLDSWMLPETTLRTLFARSMRDADLAVVEGVMGLFDGRSGEGEVGSTAHVARILGLPVLLVLDAAKTARSAAATALGFARFEPGIDVVGCLLNNVASDRHRRLVAEAVEGEAGLPVLGALGRDPELRLEERYLGLVPTAERTLPDGLLDRLTGAVERDVNLDCMLDLTAVGQGHPGDNTSAEDDRSEGNDHGIDKGRGNDGKDRVSIGSAGITDNTSVILSAAKDLRTQDLRRSFAALRMTTSGSRRGGQPGQAATESGSATAVEGTRATATEDADARAGETKDAPAESAHRATEQEASDASDLFPPAPIPTRVRIGVARDAAFSFYYEDNLDLLRAWGAELVDFSPLDDHTLPPDLGALYFGGGFPELFADRLASNTSLVADVRRAAVAGMPIVAECGGLMYLGEMLTDRDGRRHRMAGVLPAHSSLERARLTLGYREVVVLHDSPLLRTGEGVRGHEFHWSQSDAPPAASAAFRLDAADGRLSGYASDSLLASYVHLHFGTDSRLAPRFVEAAVAWSKTTAVQPSGASILEPQARLTPTVMHGSPDGLNDDPVVLPTDRLSSTSVASSTTLTSGRLLRRHGFPPRETELLSMRRILERFGDRLPAAEPERSLVARLVYTAGDPALIPDVRWADGAIGSAVGALRRGGSLVVDVRMVAAGLDRRTLDRLGVEPIVAIDAAGVGALAERDGITRSAAGIIALGARLDGAVMAIGNAPTALLALLDLAETGVARPAAILGFPVGFVAAAESKDELVRSGQPYVTVLGTRGGSPLATAAVNYLARLAGMPTDTDNHPDLGHQVDTSHRARTGHQPDTAHQAESGDNPHDERHADHAATR